MILTVSLEIRISRARSPVGGAGEGEDPRFLFGIFSDVGIESEAERGSISGKQKFDGWQGGEIHMYGWV